MCSAPAAGAIKLSAGSYRDVSRVANINDALWSRLFLDNRECLLEELDELLGNLEKFREQSLEETRPGCGSC